MRNPYVRGFGITAIIIAFAVIVLGAGGAYLYVEQDKKAKTADEPEQVLEQNEEKPVDLEEEAEEDSLAEKETVKTSVPIHPKVKAEVYIYEDSSGVSNRFNITCKVGTERQVSVFYIYPGDGSEYSASPTAGRDQVNQTHTYPVSSAISYNAKCVPVYDSTDSPYTHLSPYVGTAVASVKAEVSPPVADEISDAYKDAITKIKPIDSDSEVASAAASYKGIIAADSDDEARPHIISEEYETWGGRADENGNYEGWSDEGWSLKGYSKAYMANGEKVVVLWFDVLGEPAPLPLAFAEENSKWKLSPAGTIGFALLYL